MCYKEFDIRIKVRNVTGIIIIIGCVLLCYFIYRSDQLSDTKNSLTEIEKNVESDHCSSGNPNTVDDNNQPSGSTPTRVR